ncbi:MAG: hypothetical protein JNJ54_01810 [Myxococcaceae bacterium]|nr:hypothetical protein [Myxococcaceae bacterium]
MSRSICAGIADTFCVEGLDAARGAMLGEHALITRLAMRWANVPATLLDDQDVLRYYGDGAMVHGVPSVEPAAAGKMSTRIGPAGLRRRLTIPEFAQVPDVSHSLSDFLAGNEHCPLAFAELHDGTREALDACHTFAKHMGVVNAGHFGDQVKELYRQYHSHALDVARKCKEMSDLFAAARDGGHFASPSMVEAIPACEREAMVLEAVASHFLADAWSTGHMWQRWGSPVQPTTVEAYLRAHMVAAASGIIHGYRAVARGSLFTRANQHDQLCMPGAFPDEAGQSVRFVQPQLRSTSFEGGGDLYALACQALDPDAMPPAAVLPFTPVTDSQPATGLGLESTERPWSFQYKRMMTCLARSARDVYAAGPRHASDGELRLWAVTSAQLDTFIRDSTNDVANISECWGARVTNASMVLGLRLGDAQLTTSLTGRMAMNLLPTAAQQRGDPGFFQTLAGVLPKQNNALRVQLIRFEALATARAARNPEGTDVAELAGTGGLDVLLGSRANRDAVPLVRQGGVGYLERPSRAQWSDEGALQCTTDRDCARAGATDHVVCDRFGHSPADGGFAPRCTNVEAATLRAFHSAELPYYCAADTPERLLKARDACRGKPGSSVECQACAELHLPRLRNACDPGEGFIDYAKHRSACDVLLDGGVSALYARENAVHVPFEPRGNETLAEAAQRTALAVCQSAGAELIQRAHAYGFSGPDAGVSLIGGAWFGSTRTMALCGLLGGEHWVHYRWQSPMDQRPLRVRLSSVMFPAFGFTARTTDFELAVLPACDPSSPQVQRVSGGGAPIVDGGPPAELTLGAVDLPDFCIRVRPLSRTMRSGFVMRVEFDL